MKTEEDEAFDELAKKQGMWGGGFHAKKAMAMDKCQGMNCQKSDVNPEHSLECEAEHAATIAGGYFVKTTPPAQDGKCGLCGEDQPFTGTCGGGKENPIALCFTPPAQPAQEPVTWMVTYQDGSREVVYEAPSTLNPDISHAVLHRPSKRDRVLFPTMLRKMWSGGEVQAWLDENVNKEKNA